MIPGAMKTDDAIVGNSQCGIGIGLATGGTNTKTICCKYSHKSNISLHTNSSEFLFFPAKSLPFRVRFASDTYEGTGAMLEAVKGVGFKLRYFQTTCS